MRKHIELIIIKSLKKLKKVQKKYKKSTKKVQINNIRTHYV